MNGLKGGVLASAAIALAACGTTPVSAPPPSTSPPPAASPASPSVEQGGLAAQGPYLPDAYLTVCNMAVANRPEADATRRVRNFSPLIVVQGGVILAAAPANNACLSSGFGPRNGRPHQGIDLQSNPASIVFSGGPGVIREVNTARGYGKQIVIDHGRGVFTRYAHLATIDPAIREGAVIGFGQPLGLMGETGNATAIHLHYEVLVGEWGGQRSFGLTPTNPLSWPAYVPGGVSG